MNFFTKRKTLVTLLLMKSCIGCQPADDGAVSGEIDGDREDENSLLFVHPSSDEVVQFAREKASALPIKTTVLGDDIYGTHAPQGRKVGGEFPYRWHDLRIRDVNELAETRYGAVWMAYRRYWAKQDGWEDHVYDLQICRDLPVDAARFPQSQDEWRSGDVTVGIRLVFPNTPAAIKEATRRLRDCASKCLEFAKQNDITDGLKLELYLELYEPCEFPSTWVRKG